MVETYVSSSGFFRRIVRNRAFYLFVAPFFIAFAVFWVWPLIQSFYLSLTVWPGLGAAKFTWFSNYAAIVADDSFRVALFNTLLFTAVSVPVQVGLGLIFATLLNAGMVKSKPFFRSMFFTPHILSPIIIGTIFLFLLDSHYGVLNYLLRLLGLPAVPWLTDPTWMRASIISVSAWQWVGWNSVVLLAGMQNIPHEVHEAARIDGARETQVFRKITVPMLWPVVFFAIVIGTIGSLQMFAAPFALSANQKGPGNSAYTIVYAVWREAFEFSRFGRASAIAYVLFAATMIVTLVQMRFRDKEENS